MRRLTTAEKARAWRQAACILAQDVELDADDETEDDVLLRSHISLVIAPSLERMAERIEQGRGPTRARSR